MPFASHRVCNMCNLQHAHFTQLLQKGLFDKNILFISLRPNWERSWPYNQNLILKKDTNTFGSLGRAFYIWDSSYTEHLKFKDSHYVVHFKPMDCLFVLDILLFNSMITFYHADAILYSKQVDIFLVLPHDMISFKLSKTYSIILLC